MINLQVDDHLYAYDAQGRLVADSQLIGQNGSPSNYHKYQYDAAGNVVKDELYYNNGGTFQNYGTSTYTFDDHPNPMYSNNGMALYLVFQDIELLSKNNATSLTSQSSGSTTAYNRSISYNYYSNGYPRHAAATFSGSGSGTATAEYYYKAP
jgi:YD repeat-containing protein